MPQIHLLQLQLDIVGRRDLSISIPKRKTPKRLSEILARDELRAVFSNIENQKHRTILMTTYGCGLRISEVINLKPSSIDSSRMMVRIEKGKGDKDRYTILSPQAPFRAALLLEGIPA